MTSHGKRVLAAIPAVLCLALSASTGALAQTPAGDTKADYPGTAPVAKLGDTPGDVATGARWTALARQYSSHGAKIGDTPADFAQPVAPAPKAGDTPADHPGASRAPRYDPPTTITVNRPERTIVRDVDQLLPTVLAGLALVVALASAGFALIRTRSAKGGVVGRSHRRPGGAHPGSEGPARASSPSRARRAPAVGTAPSAPDGATGRTHNTKEQR